MFKRKNQKGGNSKNNNLDCLGNKISQLGYDPLVTNTPSLSEQAFLNRYSVGKSATGGGRRKQKCGCTAEHEGGGYYLGLDKNVGGLPEVVPYFDCNKPTHAPRNAGKVIQPNFNVKQTGGSEAYRYIVNPKSGRKVSVTGRIGRKVLQMYLRQSGGMRDLQTAFTGVESVFDPNMSQRNFGCRQPQWNPSCV